MILMVGNNIGIVDFRRLMGLTRMLGFSTRMLGFRRMSGLGWVGRLGKSWGSYSRTTTSGGRPWNDDTISLWGKGS